MTRKRKTNEVDSTYQSPIVISSQCDTNSNEDISVILSEIRMLDNVIGYISRNETSAAIDLKEQDKLVDYAMISSQIFESGESMAKALDIDSIECIHAEGKGAKVFCITIDENKISVFTDPSFDKDIKRMLVK